ncbi:hypothetical protein FA13DRAFT_1317451 [Coprinellus micaceus]|uniref:Uncharacterized protein n=1 Tax=Coprinellus micaceus TaxID=71717 RepID=A0A4Y7SRR1_COPMI|nr:hypothetical protein FA13DRAFT_1317451 [Coprinellus micaceus]
MSGRDREREDDTRQSAAPTSSLKSKQAPAAPTRRSEASRHPPANAPVRSPELPGDLRRLVAIATVVERGTQTTRSSKSYYLYNQFCISKAWLASIRLFISSLISALLRLLTRPVEPRSPARRVGKETRGPGDKDRRDKGTSETRTTSQPTDPGLDQHLTPRGQQTRERGNGSSPGLVASIHPFNLVNSFDTHPQLDIHNPGDEFVQVISATTRTPNTYALKDRRRQREQAYPGYWN